MSNLTRNKIQKKLTKVQEEMSSQCIKIQMHCNQSGAGLFFLRNSYNKILENPVIAEHAEIKDEIISLISMIDEEAKSLSEISSIVKETMIFVQKHKKDRKITNKVRSTMDNPKVNPLIKGKFIENYKDLTERLGQIKDELGIIDPTPEVSELPTDELPDDLRSAIVTNGPESITITKDEIVDNGPELIEIEEDPTICDVIDDMEVLEPTDINEEIQE